MSLVTFKTATPKAEEIIVELARVSNPSNAKNMDTAPQLLRYLINHKHWSPFQMAHMTVTIQTERDIAAQILRHKSFSFQEYSTRYAEAQTYTVPELRRQDFKNRQNSIDDIAEDYKQHYKQRIVDLLDLVQDLYQDMLHDGIAKECARRILPLCTKTTMHMTGDLRSWIHYIQIRTDVSTQLEHRRIAEQCKEIFCNQFPIIGEAAFK
jgi:thymidylate synthase (FAD)